MKRRENLTAALYLQWHTHLLNPNDDTSLFIEKIKVTSCEITKLPLTRSRSFTGYKASRVDRFSAMHLRGATLHSHFGVLLCLDTSDCSFGLLFWSDALQGCYQAATSERDSDLALNPKLRICLTFLLGVLRPHSGICKRGFSK